jgi:seryl-tRNA synthetase
MIDIRLVRDDPSAVKTALGRRGVDPADVDALVDLDARARAAIGGRDELGPR